MKRCPRGCRPATPRTALDTHPTLGPALRRYGAQIVRFEALPTHFQTAITRIARDDLDTPDDHAGEYWGVSTLPIEEIQLAQMHGEIGRDFKTWTSYHKWYVSQGGIPDHGTSVWPITLSTDDTEDPILDGSHRLHSYFRKGLKMIPVIWYEP